MDLASLLADPSYDLPVPPDALTSVRSRANRLRRRRRVLTAVPTVGAVLLALPLLGGHDTANIRYGEGALPTASPTPPPLPYQSPRNATSLQCVTDGSEPDFAKNGGGYGDLLTGDPIADCAELGRQQGFSVPLRAYHNGAVFLTVVPASWTLPSSYRPLPAGYTVDPKRLALKQALGDPLDGPFADLDDEPCRTDAEALAAGRQVLQEIGLDYAVGKYDAAPVADGQTVCARALLEDGKQKVLVTANERITSDSGPQNRYGTFRHALQKDVAQACLTPAQAEATVRADAATAGFSASEYRVLTTAVGGGGRCTRIDYVSFALLEAVVLRTP